MIFVSLYSAVGHLCRREEKHKRRNEEVSGYRLVLQRSLGADRWDGLPPLVWVGQGAETVRTAVSAAILHLEDFGLEFLDLANPLVVIVSVDL